MWGFRSEESEFLINTENACKITGLSLEVMVRMRGRETTTQLSGPPFRKTFKENGTSLYLYALKELRKWCKERKSILLTAKDASIMLGISREELLKRTGLSSEDVNSGVLYIDNKNNLYVFKRKK